MGESKKWVFFEWDYSHLSSNNHLSAISQRRWVCQPPIRMYFTSSLSERCILISGRIVKKHICFVICKKGTFEWDYSHLFKNNRSRAISQRRWVCQPPTRMCFTSSLKERCILISGCIVKKYISFVICKKGLSNETTHIFLVIIVYALYATEDEFVSPYKNAFH